MTTPTPIPNPPDVRELPPTPSRANATNGDLFSALMDGTLATLPLWSGDLEALAQWTYERATQMNSALLQAQGVLSDVQTIGSQKVQAASDHADSAAADAALGLGYKNTAEAAAAAVQSAAGMPAIAGRLGQSLTVIEISPGLLGVAWEPVGATVGTVQSRPWGPEPDWLPLDGSTYAVADYPELAALYPIWAYNLQEAVTGLPGLDKEVSAAAGLSDGSVLAVVGEFTTGGAYLQLWDMATKSRMVTSMPALGGRGTGVDVDPSDRFIAVTAYSSSSTGFYVADTSDWATVLLGPITGRHGSPKFSPDGQWLLVINPSYNVEVYETSTWSLVATLDAAYPYGGADWSPDGTRIAASEKINITPGVSLDIWGVGTWAKAGSYSIPNGPDLVRPALSWGLGTITISCSGYDPKAFAVEDTAFQVIGEGLTSGGASVSNSASSDGALVAVAGANSVGVYGLPPLAPVLAMNPASTTASFACGDKYLVTGSSSAPYYSVIMAKSETTFTAPNAQSVGLGVVYKVRAKIS